MILSITKRIWFLGLITIFCSGQLYAMSDAALDLANLGICIDQLLCERFQLLQRLVDRQICEENELLTKAIESFNIRLKEFIAGQQKASDARLKDFIRCRLERTEHNLEGFICHKINCLGDFIEAQLGDLNCDIEAALANISVLDENIDCFAANFLLFLEILNTFEGAGNPFIGALDAIIVDLNECIAAALLDTCSDIVT